MNSVASVNKAWSPSHFTFGSHSAIFKGFLPSVNKPIPLLNSKFSKLFRLSHGGFPGKQNEIFQLNGPSIIEGFRRKGYKTFGTGAVGWFDPETETGQCLTSEFDEFFYPGSTWRLAEQLSWIDEKLLTSNSDYPLFIFLNIGETHVPYWHKGALWDKEENPCVPFQKPSRQNRHLCRTRQKSCLEYVDKMLQSLLNIFMPGTIVITADHGDCWGENGLWEHGIIHKKTLEVPLIMRVRGNPL